MSVHHNGADIDELNLDHLLIVSMHNTQVFPSATNLLCTFTAHADANTWSEWTEIVDSGAASLSTEFADHPGHITDLVVEGCSEASKRYMFEIAYGAAKVPVSRWRIISETNQLSVSQATIANGVHIPAGETIYYRAMCETAGSKTATVYIKYFVMS
jgi:hypothetical protein